MRAWRVVPVALLAAGGVVSCELVYGLDGYQDAGASDAAAHSPDATADTGGQRDASAEGDVALDALDAGSHDAGCDGCGPSPVALSPAPYGWYLAGDDASLYWIAEPPTASRAIMRTDKNDGGTSVLVADAGSLAADLTVDDTRVYWTTRAADGGLGGTVQAIGKNGVGAAVLLSAADWRPTALAVDDASVYVENPIDTGSGGLLSRVAKDGGARIPMVTTGGAASPTVDEALAVDNLDVYYLHQSAIYRVPKSCVVDASSCAPVQVTLENPSSYDVYAFTVDGTQIYWTMEYATSTHPCGTYAVPKSTAPASEVLLSPACGSGCAVDGRWVYAISSENGPSNILPFAVFAGPIDGGAEGGPITGTQLQPRTPIVADGVAIYWIDGIDSAGDMAKLMKLPRP